ncbi:MAG: hypothetical protein AAGI01_05690, partial [Myxococcota bacterium]
CEGAVELTNIGPPPLAGGVRVLVLHAETGAPVASARVRLGGLPATTTDLNGVATSARPPGDAYDVSVFAQEFDYVSVLGVRASDIRIPVVPKRGTGLISGFTGALDTSALNTTGDILLGLAGASISGGLINFELASVLGDPFATLVTIPGQGSANLPLPGGLVISGRVLGINLQIKQDYFAKSPGGARLGWALGGRVPISELLPLLMGGGVDDLGDVLAQLLPLFSRFDHGLKPLDLLARMRVLDTADFDGDGDTTELLPDYANFTSADIAPSQRQSLVTSIDVSNLPTLSGGQAEVAILLGGTVLQSAGLVPLGISATSDGDGDGRPDVQRLTLTPQYGVAVGGRYSVLAISARLDNFGASPSGSVEFPDELSVALWNGPSLPPSLSLGTFPGTADVSFNPRRRVMTLTSPAGPLYRARFVGFERSWDVWSVGRRGEDGQFSHRFTVPQVPDGVQDLVSVDNILVDSIRTQVSLDALVQPSGVILYDVGLVSTGFSRTSVR